MPVSVRAAVQTAAVLAFTLLGSCVSPTGGAGEVSGPRALSSFSSSNEQCYDRAREPFTAVVDSHLHFRPFGGAPIPLADMTAILKKNGVLFANMYGIGQSLPIEGPCEYYLDCVGTPALPSLKNDFANAQALLDAKPKDVHLTLSMTFPDLAKPEDVLKGMALLDREYPGRFRWMGEVNLVKQALFGNAHRATPMAAIKRWAPFMAELKRRGIPLALHADLGSNAEQTKYLPLVEEVLRRYPDNTIVWMHLGLSKELTTLDADRHIKIVSGLFDRYKNLHADISWRVLYDNAFSKPEARAKYVAFLNKYSDRILPGTDFVALWRKTEAVYAEELRATSDILRDVDDRAFRNIALGQNYFRLLKLDYRAPRVCGVKPA